MYMTQIYTYKYQIQKSHIVDKATPLLLLQYSSSTHSVTKDKEQLHYCSLKFSRVET